MTRTQTEDYNQSVYSTPNNDNNDDWSDVGERLDLDGLLDNVEDETDDSPLVDAVSGLLTLAYLKATA